MPKLIMTRGLPASGKSTWAKQQVDAGNGRVKRINKDDLRAMIDNSTWSKQNEDNIIKVRDTLVKHYLSNGFDVIVDDTNFSLKHEKVLEKIAEEYSAEFEIESFVDVPLAVCIARNEARSNPVPVNAIKSMYNTYLKGKSNVAKYKAPEYKEDFPFCIIVDIDGTLAHGTGRNMYDFTQIHTDAHDVVVGDIVRKYAAGSDIPEIPDNYIVIVSGREDTCKEQTENWLVENKVPYHEIYMRKQGDMRDDTIVKREIYEEFIKPRYNVRFVLDDRNKVVKMWREQGLKVLQVEDGDF